MMGLPEFLPPQEKSVDEIRCENKKGLEKMNTSTSKYNQLK